MTRLEERYLICSRKKICRLERLPTNLLFPVRQYLIIEREIGFDVAEMLLVHLHKFFYFFQAKGQGLDNVYALIFGKFAYVLGAEEPPVQNKLELPQAQCLQKFDAICKRLHVHNAARV